MLPRFIPMSQAKNAAPTGPRPNARTDSQPAALIGQAVTSHNRCASNDRAAVARQ